MVLRGYGVVLMVWVGVDGMGWCWVDLEKVWGGVERVGVGVERVGVGVERVWVGVIASICSSIVPMLSIIFFVLMPTGHTHPDAFVSRWQSNSSDPLCFKSFTGLPKTRSTKVQTQLYSWNPSWYDGVNASLSKYVFDGF